MKALLFMIQFQLWGIIFLMCKALDYSHWRIFSLWCAMMIFCLVFEHFVFRRAKR